MAHVDRFVLDARHFRNAGPANVRVHDADDVRAVGGQGLRQHGGEGGFADAAFAGEDEDLVADGR